MSVDPAHIMQMFVGNIINVCTNIDKVIDCWTAYKLKNSSVEDVSTWFLHNIFDSKVNVSIYDDEIMIFACADLRISKRILDHDGEVLYDHIISNPEDFFNDIGHSKTDKVRSMLTSCKFNEAIDDIVCPELICGRFMASMLSNKRGFHPSLVNMECVYLSQKLQYVVKKFACENPKISKECIRTMSDVLFFGFQTIIRGDWEPSKDIIPLNTINM